MNRDAKLYGGIIVVVAALYLAKSTFDSNALNDLFVVSAVLGAIGIGGKLVQDMKIKNRLNKHRKSKGAGISYSTNACKDIAKEWAKENFHGKINSKKGVSFDWTQSSTDPAQVYDFRNEEWIFIRYFYTPYGPKNQGVFIFVDATNGDHYATKPVKKHEMKDNPYNYLESYRQTKRFAGRIRYGDDDQNQNIQAVTGIPVTNGYVPESEDEG